MIETNQTSRCPCFSGFRCDELRNVSYRDSAREVPWPSHLSGKRQSCDIEATSDKQAGNSIHKEMVSLSEDHNCVRARETERGIDERAAGNLAKSHFLAPLQSTEGLHRACAQREIAGAADRSFLPTVGMSFLPVNQLAGNEAKLSSPPSMQPLPPVEHLFRLADGAQSGSNHTAWLENERGWYASSEFLTPLPRIRMIAAA